MINVPILGQRDNRWASVYLGFGTGTIGNYGCLLTCLTALAGKNNVYDTNELFKKNGAFQGNLVLWANVPKALPNLKFVYRYYSYDNTKVSDYVYNKKTPVCVEVDAAPIGSPRTSHWLLFLGDQKCLDPWVGQIRSTGDFPGRKGFALCDLVQAPPPALNDTQKVNLIRTTLHRPDIGDSQKVIEALKITG
jgi:hypothetical protein